LRNLQESAAGVPAIRQAGGRNDLLGGAHPVKSFRAEHAAEKLGFVSDTTSQLAEKLVIGRKAYRRGEGPE
jgi:hypothetical protein